MKRDAQHPIGLDDAIIVDEVGIESGGYGIYRLRSLYQPIFALRGRSLRVVAVEGTVAPYVAGEEAPASMFQAAVAADDLEFIDRISLALPLRNHRNIGLDTLELLVDPDGDERVLIDRIGFMAGELNNAELDPALVVCAVGGPVAQDAAMLARLAREMRGCGMRIAIGDFGAGHWTDEAIDRLAPEIVRIDGAWFRQVCRDATTVRLFEAVVSRLRERSSTVLVTGIGNEMQLGVALRAGAELFQGSHLASPILVGTAFDDAPLSLAKKLGDARNIVPLFG